MSKKADEFDDALDPAKNPMIKVPYRSPEEEAAAEAWALRNLDQRAPFAPLPDLGGGGRAEEVGREVARVLGYAGGWTGDDIRIFRAGDGGILVNGRAPGDVSDADLAILKALKPRSEE